MYALKRAVGVGDHAPLVLNECVSICSQQPVTWHCSLNSRTHSPRPLYEPNGTVLGLWHVPWLWVTG